MANYTLNTENYLKGITVPSASSSIQESKRKMKIVPNTGFVVSASDFSQTGTPGDIMSFLDTEEAGQPGNEVEITVDLAVGDVTFDYSPSLGTITGDAKIYEENEYLSGRSYVDYFFSFDSITTPINSTQIFTKVDLTTALTHTAINQANSGIEVNPGQDTSVGAVILEANTGYYFNEPIDFQTYNKNGVVVSFNLLSTGKNIDGYTTKYVYSINYLADKNTYDGDSIIVSLRNPEALIIPTKVIDVSSLDFGSPLIDLNGETKQFKFTGSIGADFDFQVVGVGSNSFNADYNVRIVSSNSMQSGYSSRIEYKSIAVGGVGTDYVEADSIVLEFDKQSTSQQYEVILDVNGDTVLSSSIPNANPRYTLNQYVNPVLRFGATDGTTDYVGKAVVGRPNLTAEDLSHVYDFKDLNFTVTTTVPNTTLTVQPYNETLNFIGRVDSGFPRRIYFDTSILPSWVTVQNQVGVHENVVGSNARLVTTIASTYIETSNGLDPLTLFGEYMSFTLKESSFGIGIVDMFTGGEVQILNESAAQDGNDIVYTFDVSIDKFPNQDVDYFTYINQT